MTALENVLVGEHVRLHSNLFGKNRPRCKHDERGSERARQGTLPLEFVGLHREDADVTAKNLPYGLQRRLEICSCTRHRSEASASGRTDCRHEPK